MHRLPLTCALVVLTACAKQAASPAVTPTAQVVATVNGAVLTVDDVSAQAAGRGHSTPSADQVIDALVTEELAAQQATRLGLALEPSAEKELAKLEAAVTSARRRGLANAWYAKLTREALQVSDAEARAYFDAHREELRAQHQVVMVLRRSRAEIEQVQQALAGGAPLGSIEGVRTDLGWLGYGQLAPAWRPVLAGLKPGEVSGVIAGDHDRFWLLELVEVREGPELSFEQARPMVVQALGAERALPARETAEASLRKAARITLSKPEPAQVGER